MDDKRIGSLTNDDPVATRTAKNILARKITTLHLHVQHAFLTFLHTNLTHYGGREHGQ